jgi:hypothetical protein
MNEVLNILGGDDIIDSLHAKYSFSLMGDSAL